VDAAEAGDEIVVTNGVYQTGAREVYGMSNRVAVTKPVTLRSVNGREATHIVGYQVPDGLYGPAAVRCVYLTNGAVLAGFTLSNGSTQNGGDAVANQSGGGVWCEGAAAVVSNCVITGNVAYVHGGGAYRGLLNDCALTENSTDWSGGGTCESRLKNCALIGNSAYGRGGGADRSTLKDCTLTGNSGSAGGGACESMLEDCELAGNSAILGAGTFQSTLNGCRLAGNSAAGRGGGACASTLNDCELVGNSVHGDGGGAYESTLNNCQLAGNSASGAGGGANGGMLSNCALTGNSAEGSGGGANGGRLSNCVLTGNSAGDSGGGSHDASLNNCIVYYNHAGYEGANYYGGSFRYCCSTPVPEGVGNVAEDPQLASAWRLSAGSPCRGRGSGDYASGLDLDGEPWANPPSIGCDEPWSGSLTGAVSVAILAGCTNVATGFAVDLQALIEGRISASRWDFGDGMVLSNRPWATHAWTTAGDYVVELRAYNESCPTGVAATVVVHVIPSVLYVARDSAHPTPPYTSWATAATTMQDAVDEQVPGVVEILVTNGVYQTGAREVSGMTNRVAVTKPVTVRSVNGPDATQIVGYQVPGTRNGPAAVRCVYLANGVVLAGFTLTNGATQAGGSGGGVWCEGPSAVVSNCVLTGNSAGWWGGGASGGTLSHCTLRGNSADSGGASYYGTLDTCELTGNSAGWWGGGAYGGTLDHCTLTGNSAFRGGGAHNGTLNSCVLVDNSATTGGGAGNSTLIRCTLTGNSAGDGGGACLSTLNNCTLTGNLATHDGGGAWQATLNNCALTLNRAGETGGGASFGTFNNCTLTGNSAGAGGGVAYGAANNCIVYYNTARDSGANYTESTLRYSCSTPLPDGPGNLSEDPQLASTSHLSAGSPCRGGGGATYASGTDIDGEPWSNPPSMGCDDYRVGMASGTLSVAVVAANLEVVAGAKVNFQAVIEGPVSASSWDFGDGVIVSNRPWVTHIWTTVGEYTVELRAFNDSYPGGVATTIAVRVQAPRVHYVALTSVNPVPPYSSWATAATNIQAAVDAATVPGDIIWVSNGVYRVGGLVVDGQSNRVALTRPVTLMSVNGPAVTQI